MAQGSVNRGIIVGVAVVVLAGGGFLLFKLNKNRQARHDLDELWIGLTAYLKDQGSYPDGTTAEVCTLLLGTPVRDQNQRRLVYIETPRPRELNAAGEFVDPWNTPYRILFEPALKVYSCGPNRVDEHGGGDDILPTKQ